MEPTPPKRKKISLVSGCYNEEGNLHELCRRVALVMDGQKAYDWDHVLIDNASSDQTPRILRELAAGDRRIKVIFNARNFGHVRSPYHGLLQADGDAMIYLASDLQDPPEKIPEFIALWEQGYRVVAAVKTGSQESLTFFTLRRLYYWFVSSIANIRLVQNFTGFGLYDRKVVDIMRGMEEPYPYVRGLISEIGFPIAQVPYHQPLRKRGITKNNFFTLYDVAMLGLTSHSKAPLRLAVMCGLLMAGLSMGVAAFYLLYKLLNWNSFSVGVAPLVIGLFFFSSIQLIFIGILGEYIGALLTYAQKRPHVVEAERLNF